MEDSLLVTVLSLLTVVALLLGPMLLAVYEYRLGSAKASSEPGFNWEEQLAYRIDYW